MKDIVIVGAGGLGRETALLIQQINAVQSVWNFLGYYDDYQHSIDHYLGTLNDLQRIAQPLCVAIAIAHPATRKKIYTLLMNNEHLTFPVLMHPNFNRGAATNSFGQGCILTAGSICTSNVHAGEFVIINLLCSIGHDAQLGAFTSLMPNVSISGHVVIGAGCFIGTGARILPQLEIDADAIIGAGAVVTKSVRAGATVVGMPGREI